MSVVQRKLTRTFREFFDDQKSSGIILIVCTAVSLIITNSPIGENYLKVWHFYVAGLSIEHWINDGLMAIFFLLIGLELRREIPTASCRISNTLFCRFSRQSAESCCPR